MSSVDCSLEELLGVRSALVKTINQSLTKEEKLFLLSLKRGEPQWELLTISHIHKLPAIQWKLHNIRKMDRKKHNQAIEKLKAILQL